MFMFTKLLLKNYRFLCLLGSVCEKEGIPKATTVSYQKRICLIASYAGHNLFQIPVLLPMLKMMENKGFFCDFSLSFIDVKGQSGQKTFCSMNQ